MTNHRRIALSISLLCGLGTASSAFADGHSGSILLPGDALFAGQSLVSDTCYYHLDMQSDNNLVVYAGVGNAASQAVWSANSQYTAPGFPAYYAIMQNDGNFVFYRDWYGQLYPTYSTGTVTNEFSEVWMQNDGNLVLYGSSPGSNSLWSTGTHGNYYGPTPCSMTSRITHIEQAEDLPGQDFAHECTNDSVQCGQWCADRPGACVAWTWTPPGASGSCSETEGQCWMKSSVPSATYHGGMVSGVVRTVTP